MWKQVLISCVTLFVHGSAQTFPNPGADAEPFQHMEVSNAINRDKKEQLQNQPEIILTVSPEETNSQSFPDFCITRVSILEGNDQATAQGPLTDIEKALRLESNNSEILRICVMKKLELTDYHGALADLDDFLRLDPNNSEALQTRGKTKLMLDDYQGSLDDLDESLHLEPNNSEALRIRAYTKLMLCDYKGSLDDLDESLRLEPNNSETLRIRARTKIILMEYDGSLVDLDKSLRLEPKTAESLRIRGEIKRILRFYPGSLTDLDESLLLEPNNSEALRWRGNTKRMLRDYNGSLVDLDESLRLKPNNSEALRIRGETKRLLGDYQGSLIDLDQSLSLKPNDAEALRWRGNTKRMLRDYNGSLVDLDKSLRLEPKNAEALQIRSETKQTLRDYHGSLDDLNESLRLEPNNEWTLLAYESAQFFRNLIAEEPFQYMVVDDHSGNVYVGAENHLYQLSRNLTIQFNATYGSKSRNNVNKTIAIHPKRGLVVCGSNGSCEVRSLINISIIQTNSREAVVSNVPDASTLIFVGPGPNSDKVLYVGSSPRKDAGPNVASRSLDADQQLSLAHPNTSITKTWERQKMFRTEYVAGEPKPPEFTSKLVRVCNNDPYYYSYTVVPLECQTDSEDIYNLIQAAYVAKPGALLAKQMNITTEDDILIAAFSPMSRFIDKPDQKAAICIYSFREIEKKFMDNIRECARGNYMLLDGQRCVNVSKEEDELVCGYDRNHPLEGKEPVIARYAKIYDSTRLTSLVATTTGSQTVVFAGTSEGSLVKILITAAGGLKEYRRITSPRLPKESAIQVLKFDNLRQSLYVMTNDTVIRVPLHECSRYHDCFSCLSAEDPFCGWCPLGGKCGTSSDCPHDWRNYQDNYCPTIGFMYSRPIHLGQDVRASIYNFPVVGDLTCVFRVRNRTIVNKVVMWTPDLIRCSVPGIKDLQEISKENPYMDAQLSIAIASGPEIATTTIQLFDCAVFDSCGQCTSDNSFHCEWCVQSSKCTWYRMEKHYPPGMIISKFKDATQHCPSVRPKQPELFVSLDDEPQISVEIEHTLDFMTNFTCVFDNGNEVNRSETTQLGNTVHCQDLAFLPALVNKTSKLSIEWTPGHALDNPQRITVYRCEYLAENCGQCLQLKDDFKCGWCRRGPLSSCTLGRNCQGHLGFESWLNTSNICPHPRILSFHPTSGPVEGGTKITINGTNLGNRFTDIENAVRVANVACRPVQETFKPGKSITCNTDATEQFKGGSIVLKIKDGNDYTSNTSDTFSYVNPAITDFNPKRGSVLGGTVVTIEGHFLDAGSNVTISIGGVPCDVAPNRTASRIQCTTGASEFVQAGTIALYIDNAKREFLKQHFFYVKPPEVTSIRPNGTISSGGIWVDITGNFFNPSFAEYIQVPRIVLTYKNKTYNDTCTVKTDQFMQCRTPPVGALDSLRHCQASPAGSSNSSRDLENIDISFYFDNGETPENLSPVLNISPILRLFPDPVFGKLKGTHLKKGYGIKIPVENRMNLQPFKKEVKVSIDNNNCNNLQVNETELFCDFLENKPNSLSGSGTMPIVRVMVGENINCLFDQREIKNSMPPSTIVAVSFATVAGLAIMAMVFTTRLLMKQRETQLKELQQKLLDSCKTPTEVNRYMPIHEQLDALPYDMKFDIPHSRIKLGEIIGQGNFGLVHKGQLLMDPELRDGLLVVVKMPKSGSMEVQNFEVLIQELKMMIYAGDHINVLKLHGAVTELIHRHKLYVLTEYCSKGSLWEVLVIRQNKSNILEVSADNYSIPRSSTLGKDGLMLFDLLSYSYQVANGMEYLAAKNLIHRDLAARNILVSGDDIIKICDFGLSRDGEYYKDIRRLTPLPFKWIPIEALEKGVFTVKSDIWSYGILNWEIFSLGKIPYPGLDYQGVLHKIREGYRLERSSLTPDAVYDMMRMCWAEEPEKRPTFTQCKSYLAIQLELVSKNVKIGAATVQQFQSFKALILKLSSEPSLEVASELNNFENDSAETYPQAKNRNLQSGAIGVNNSEAEMIPLIRNPTYGSEEIGSSSV